MANLLYAVLVSILVLHGSESLYFQQQAEYKEYNYMFTGTTAVDDVHTFKVEAKIKIIPVSESKLSQLCRFEVERYVIFSMENGVGRQVALKNSDFSKWCSFGLSSNGVIENVYYDKDEDLHILALKKTILGTISSKLIISESQIQQGGRWAYKVNETGHDGYHEAKYQAEHHNGIIYFAKNKLKAPIEGAKHAYQKSIRIRRNGVLEHSQVDESIKTAQSIDPKSMDKKTYEEFLKQDENKNMPSLGGNSTMKLTLLNIMKTTDQQIKEQPGNSMLKSTSLEIGNLPQPAIGKDLGIAWIRGNLTCATKAKLNNDKNKWIHCSGKLRNVLIGMNHRDVVGYTNKLKQTASSSPDVWLMYINGLGSTMSYDRLDLLLKETILSRNTTAEVLLSAMTHFLTIKFCPRKAITNTFEEKVFMDPWYFLNDTQNTELVNKRALLVLGALVGVTQQCDKVWSDKIHARIEKKLGIHDPYHHRETRRTMTLDEFDTHLGEKTVLILSLGNARIDTSLEYYKSYLNHSETHLNLRCSAVEALSKHHSLQAAEMLLTVVITDGDETVRQNALQAYETHPYGTDVETLDHMIRYGNITKERHKIVKRSVENIAAKLWKGFQFELNVPGYDWRKVVGNAHIGASLGIVIKNMFSLKMENLNSRAVIHIHDGAWLSFHIGLIGLNFDVFRAELCFRGVARFDGNILAEATIDDTDRHITLFEKKVIDVSKNLKNTLETFRKQIVKPSGPQFANYAKRYAESVKEVSMLVLDFNRLGKAMLSIQNDYTNIGAIQDEIKAFSEDTNQLLTDIKSDITEMNMFTQHKTFTVLPWAWNEIVVAFNSMASEFRNITKSPRKTTYAMGKYKARVTTAVDQLIDAKDTIKKAKIFSQDKMPEWMIVNGVQTIKDNMKKLNISVLESRSKVTATLDEIKESREFTGINMTYLRNSSIAEIWHRLSSMLSGSSLYQFEGALNRLLQNHQILMSSVAKIENGWASLSNGYNKLRTDIQSLFGVHFHRNFPNTLLLSQSCGNGFWEFTGAGNYKHPGISVTNPHGEVYAPVNGIITKTGDKQVTMTIDEMDDTEIILENVELYEELNDTQIGAGEPIGLVCNWGNCGWCLDEHIHVTMRKISVPTVYMDPSQYMEQRGAVMPVWNANCNYYVFRFMGLTLQEGGVVGAPVTHTKGSRIPIYKYEIPRIPPEIEEKPAISNNMTEFINDLGLHAPGNVKEVFQLTIFNISMMNIIQYLERKDVQNIKNLPQNLYHKVKEIINSDTCQHPTAMTVKELQSKLLIQGKASPNAGKSVLERLYLESDKACGGTFGKNVACDFDEHCSYMKCCAYLGYHTLRYNIYVLAQIDPCGEELILNVGDWSKIIDITKTSLGLEGKEVLQQSTKMLDVSQLQVEYKVQKDQELIKIWLSVTLCSTYNNTSDQCKSQYMVTNGATLYLQKCKQQTPRNSLIKDLEDYKLLEYMQLLDDYNIDTAGLHNLTFTISEIFSKLLIDEVKYSHGEYGDEFVTQDYCFPGKSLAFGPYEVPIVNMKIPFLIGPVPVAFTLVISGYIGAEFSVTACLISKTLQATVRPTIGSVVEGSFGIVLGPFEAGIAITGYFLTTSFPTKGVLSFVKYPLDFSVRVDLEILPFRIVLHLYLRIDLVFYRLLLIDINLFEILSPSYTTNLYNENKVQKDASPPLFMFYGKLRNGVRYTKILKQVMKMRGKRSVDHLSNYYNYGTVPCIVYQIAGRDYTEPAFYLEFDAEDDRSEVVLSYCVGTFQGSCDVVNNEPLGGNSVLLTRSLINGVKLYFTVTATNTQGLTATTTCILNTYDNTVPGGRVTSNFHITSHPNILSASVFLADDTPLNLMKVAVGFGHGAYGYQIISWEDFTINDQTTVTSTDKLSHFASPRQGRLNWKAFVSSTEKTPQDCAQHCLAYPSSKCMSFNYDYGPGQMCDLLSMVEGHTKLYQSGNYYYFERKGIGMVAALNYPDLSLIHNMVYFFNVYTVNELGFEAYLSSAGILVDLTPPFPGLIVNASDDKTIHSDCYAYTPSHLHKRCDKTTPIQNHRYVVDGKGSKAVFNGHIPMTDLVYTRANTMISANWDGFHDNETGIAVYTWSSGTKPCASDVHDHKDPHDHIAHESEWTHVGIAYPLSLDDGHFHITVRALNKVEFGGPMAITVCHSTPYTIDTSPPVITEVNQATYNETTHVISLTVKAHEDLSEITSTQLAFGRSRRDTYIMAWTRIPDFRNINFESHLPNGIPVWVKVQITNIVDLKSTGYSPRPIFVDNTPPIPGKIYHGTHIKINIPYQWQTETLCVNWDGFIDPDSGISMFWVALGTSQAKDDVFKYIQLEHTVSSYCFTNLHLSHMDKYYVTLIAANSATISKNVSASSQGVLIDTTKPLTGWVKDGLLGKSDIDFSSSIATIDANWGDFKDAESNIVSTDIHIYRTVTGSSENQLIHSETGLPNDIRSISKHHFHLKHKDRVHITANVTNGAGRSSSESSDGFVVDLTDPVMVKLIDGFNVSHDEDFISGNSIAATWESYDQESGIDHFEFSVHSLLDGSKKKIYPAGNKHTGQVLGPSVRTYQVNNNLIPGGYYTIRIVSVNHAGLTSVHDTDGVLMDPSPAKMKYVHAGVSPGQTEQLIGGYVLHNDKNRIYGSWKASDPESGVAEYLVGIGTQPGSDNVAAFTSMGDNGLIKNLNLHVTEKTTMNPVYYINVIAVNGAGQKSSVMSSSPIQILEEDKEGIVWDGPADYFDDDIDFQLDKFTATVRFTGFESSKHGIVEYVWGIGSSPGADDVKPFSSEGIMVYDEGIFGLGSEGGAQLPITLISGTTYYSTIRAITGEYNVLEASSDGFAVDTSPPVIELTTKQGSKIPSTAIYQNPYKQKDNMDIIWSSMDETSSVVQSDIFMGSYPGGENILETKQLTSQSVMSNVRSLFVLNGEVNIVSITSENLVGLISTVNLSPVMIDETPPITGNLYCPSVIDGSKFSCNWEGFQDAESGIAKYVVMVGMTEGDNSILTIDVPGNATFVDIQNGSSSITAHKAVYYVTLVVFNHVGLKSVLYSSAITIDSTPPMAGWLIELSDFNTIDMSQGHVLPSKNVSMTDAICQGDLHQVRLAWQTFKDQETKIVKYEMGLGSTPGGTQIHPFVDVSPDVTFYVLKGLDLLNVKQVFAILRGYNEAGLYTSVISNGTYISRYSNGQDTYSKFHVYDGLLNMDLEYQIDKENLAASWMITGDPCPVLDTEWGINRFDGTVILPMQKVPQGQTFANADNLPLQSQASYYVKLKLTNALGKVTWLHSDGVTIKMEPLLPGIVRDGNITGIDLTYQPSVSEISANWDRFGNDRKDDSHFDFFSDTLNTEMGKHQEILHYEVAVGTDRRYPKTRNNVHHFINVGLNKNWTFTNLHLTAKKAVYYVTIRAYSVSKSSVDVTSNGIIAGVGGKVLRKGSIEIPRYIKSASKLQFTWSVFKFVDDISVMHNYWGLQSGENMDINIACHQLLSESDKVNHSLDIHMLTDVGLDTYVQVDDMKLVSGNTYTLYVVSVDESGTCALTKDIFTVDTSNPTPGSIHLGNKKELGVLFSLYNHTLDVYWNNFHDKESGIKGFTIALFKGKSCASSQQDMEPVSDSIDFPGYSDHFTFLDLSLMANVPYFVILTTKNGAGMTISTVSDPILVDMRDPIAGKVIEGQDFRHDITYQSSTREVSGSILYLLDGESQPCPFKEFSKDDILNEVIPLVHKGMWLLPKGQKENIIFSKNQVRFLEDSTVALSLERDVTEPQMLGGGVMIPTLMMNGGEFEFDVSPGHGINAVTSFTYWDGQSGMFVDVNTVVPETNNITSDGKLRIVPKPLDNDTYPTGYSSPRTPNIGFGFQIIPGQKQSKVLLWAADKDKARSVEIFFDNTKKWYTFLLSINEDEERTSLVDWYLKLYIDGKLVGELAGITGVSATSKLLIGIHSNSSSIPEITDVFNAPKTSSLIRIKRFPPPADALCLHGRPFQAAHYPIAEFQVAIGSQQYLDDISPFQKIMEPCVPCLGNCPSLMCGNSCEKHDPTLFTFRISNLALNPYANSSNIGNGSIILQSFYMTIKAITVSGRHAVSASNGFTIDPTPPKVTKITHLDSSWSAEQPIEYQGSEHSITVYWEAEDIECEIAEFHWAIGTTPGSEDIQTFTSIGTDKIASNNTLFGLLHNNVTYYATIKARNTAGMTTLRSSKGVTVLLEPPKLDNEVAEIPESSPLRRKRDLKKRSVSDINAVKTRNQKSAYCAWKIPSDENIDSVYGGIGTIKGINNVFPEMQVSYNFSGFLKLSSKGVQINQYIIGNLSDFSYATDKNISNDMKSNFCMEPGRVLICNLKACNKGHKCSKISTKFTLIARDDDIIKSSDSSGKIFIATKNLHINTIEKQRKNAYLVYGSLSQKDLEKEYKSSSSSNFSSFISNPTTTFSQTERDLYQRWIGSLNHSFYLSTIPEHNISGPVTFKIDFGLSLSERDQILPMLLAWCPNENLWVDASKSCQYKTSDSNINWIDHTLILMLCDINEYCSWLNKSNSNQRVKRQSVKNNNGFSGAYSFVLGAVNPQFINFPPTLTSLVEYAINEDAGMVMVQLEATDPDNDKFEFSLDTNYKFNGRVKITKTGFLYYTPCSDCYGVDKVHIILKEQQPIGIDPLLTYDNIKFNILAKNDNPRILTIKDGDDILPSSHIFSLNVENNSPNVSPYKELDLMFSAFDVDGDDMSFYVEYPSHGNLTILMQRQSAQSLNLDCSSSWIQRKALWDDELGKFHRNLDFSMPVPCRYGRVVTSKIVNWILMTATYTPDGNYTGQDAIKIYAVDQFGAPSYVVHVEMFILANPCWHNATCYNLDTDPTCIASKRSQGFSGYFCNCSLGYTGKYCETDINECESNPCEDGYVCVDVIGQYKCHCEDKSQCGKTSVDTWIIISVVVILIVLAICSFIWYLKKKPSGKKNKVDCSSDENVSQIPCASNCEKPIPKQPIGKPGKPTPSKTVVSNSGRSHSLLTNESDYSGQWEHDSGLATAMDSSPWAYLSSKAPVSTKLNDCVPMTQTTPEVRTHDENTDCDHESKPFPASSICRPVSALLMHDSRPAPVLIDETRHGSPPRIGSEFGKKLHKSVIGERKNGKIGSQKYDDHVPVSDESAHVEEETRHANPNLGTKKKTEKECLQLKKCNKIEPKGDNNVLSRNPKQPKKSKLPRMGAQAEFSPSKLEPLQPEFKIVDSLLQQGLNVLSQQSCRVQTDEVFAFDNSDSNDSCDVASDKGNNETGAVVNGNQTGAGVLQHTEPSRKTRSKPNKKKAKCNKK